MAAVTAADPSARAGAGERVELPNSIRVPLHEVIADLDYSYGRALGEGEEAARRMSSATREKLRAVEAAIAAALSRSPVAGGVAAEGYVLVPVEPTSEIIEAGDELCPVARGTESHRMSGGAVSEDYWAAMLAAAPKPPAEDAAPTHRVEAVAVAGDLGGVEAATQAARAEFGRWATGSDSRRPHEQRFQVLRRDGSAWDEMSAHGSSSDAESAKEDAAWEAVGRTFLDAVRALVTPAGDAARLSFTEAEFNEAGEIGERDGYERAVADIDRLTGGDGEYVCSVGAPSERHCPNVEAMTDRIVERFEALATKDRELDALRRSDDMPDGLRDLLNYLGGEGAPTPDLHELRRLAQPIRRHIASLKLTMEEADAAVDRLLAMDDDEVMAMTPPVDVAMARLAYFHAAKLDALRRSGAAGDGVRVNQYTDGGDA